MKTNFVTSPATNLLLLKTTYCMLKVSDCFLKSSIFSKQKKRPIYRTLLIFKLFNSVSSIKIKKDYHSDSLLNMTRTGFEPVLPP